MGFGNPYGDEYNEEIVFKWVDEMVKMDVGIISMADTVGLQNLPRCHQLPKKLLVHFRVLKRACIFIQLLLIGKKKSMLLWKKDVSVLMEP